MFHDKGVEHLVRSQFRAIMPKEPPAKCVVGFFCFSFLQTSQEFVEGIGGSAASDGDTAFPMYIWLLAGPHPDNLPESHP